VLCSLRPSVSLSHHDNTQVSAACFPSKPVTPHIRHGSAENTRV
jgi:hypothetical protein